MAMGTFLSVHRDGNFIAGRGYQIGGQNFVGCGLRRPRDRVRLKKKAYVVL